MCVCVCQNEKKSENEESNGQGVLTSDGERALSDLGCYLEATSSFSVIRPAEAWDVGNTSLVDVHHTI